MDLFLLLTALLCGLTGNARAADVRVAGVVQSRPVVAADVRAIALHAMRAAHPATWQAFAIAPDGRRHSAAELRTPAEPPRPLAPVAPERRRE